MYARWRSLLLPLLEQLFELFCHGAQVLVGALAVGLDGRKHLIADVKQLGVGRRAAKLLLCALFDRGHGSLLEHAVLQQVILLMIICRMGRDAHIAQLSGKLLGHLCLAVHHKNLGGLWLKGVNPLHQRVVPGVGGQPLEVDNFGLHGNLFPKHLDLLRPVEQMTAKAALGLEAHENHRALGPPQVVLEMVADTASITHAACRNDDLGMVVHVEQLGLLHRFGECFDKVARVLGLPYPGGVAMDALAQTGRAGTVAFPSAEVRGAPLDFSFSGLKTAAVNFLHNAQQKGQDFCRADFAASLMDSVAQALTGRLEEAARQVQATALVLAGGVSANFVLRRRALETAQKLNLPLYLPPLSLCGDNAAMIAAQGFFELSAGHIAPSSLNALATREIEDNEI